MRDKFSAGFGVLPMRREGKVLSIVLPLALLLNLADFNDHCGTTLDPHKDGWDDPCRQVRQPSEKGQTNGRLVILRGGKPGVTEQKSRCLL
jgi:hypothetical protein